MDNKNLCDTVKAAQNDSQPALEKLYTDYAKRVYFLSLKILKNKEDAEDITHEVFIHVFQKIGELNAPEAFIAWLNRIILNKCTDMLRKRKVPIDAVGEETEVFEFIEETDPLLIPEKSLDNAETARMIVKIIDNLPTPQRLCIYFYYYEHLTVAQIAESLNTNENTIKSRLSLAREKIRKELERLNNEDGIKLYGMGLPFIISPALKITLQEFEIQQEVLKEVLSRISESMAANAEGYAETAAGATVKIAVADKHMGLAAKITVTAASAVVISTIAAGIIIAANNSNTTNDLMITESETVAFQTEPAQLIQTTTKTPVETTTSSNEKTATRLNIGYTKLTIGEGEIFDLTYNTDSINAVKWRSGDESVITVDENGIITGVNIGEAVVYASVDGIEDECTVKVKQAPEYIKSWDISVAVNKTKGVTLEISAYTASGKISYDISDTSIAEVKNGIVKGKSAGTCTLTITTYNGVSTTVNVTVTENID